MQIQPAEWIMLLAVIAISTYSVWESDKVKVAIIEGRKTKLRAYQEAIIFLWVPTLLLLTMVAFGSLAPYELGLEWQGHLANWLGAGFVFSIAAYFFYSIYSLSNNAENVAEFREAAKNHDWMAPANKKELCWFTLGLSTSAGICEELMFRGFMIGVLGSTLGTIPSLVISSLLFGLCHIYQGWTNVLRTGIIGLILGIIYVLTESLWVVIALHILVDVYSGVVGYLLQNMTPSTDENAPIKLQG